ncbi:MAG: hypothetical protein BAA01_09930 [Bacillus thermozeamaize]|uniref:Hydantoinase n=1 Tax=Bacillus thermozeamaize TaxID=230954 RepID=A0A1Y3PIT2_9BACI|nr:MAG: hypothetical protein BAA01_09930 [Bacillus thermozeamaize]
MSLFITIDNGGTFTDICVLAENRIVRAKTLTTPHDLTRCFIDALRAAAKELYGDADIARLLKETDTIRYSTTAGTNTIVQKKGPRLGLILSKGMSPSLLQMSDEEKAMYEVMVGERVGYLDPTQDQAALEREVVTVVNQLLSQGASRLVVSFQSATLKEHEKLVKRIILDKYPRHLLGAVPVLFSHELVEDDNDHHRTWSALINSFLHPVMERFLYNAEKFLRSYGTRKPLLIYHNDGNSTRVAKTTAIKTYGSGPRGGMEGAKALARHYQLPAVLTMDIGGTTTDIGYVEQSVVKEKLHGEVEKIPTSFAMSDQISVGAGGSSVFRVTDGRLQVGPESMGAAPGPACFARGGQEATITDAYLLMGVLDGASYFGGQMALDSRRARDVIAEKVAGPLGLTLDEALLEMEKVYLEKIGQGLSTYLTDAAGTTLLAFGGAGPMSACGAAQIVGIRQVLIPRFAAVFSAFGISFSDIAHEYQATLLDWDIPLLEEKLAQLRERAERDMFAEGYSLAECHLESQLIPLAEEGTHVKRISLDDGEQLKLLEGKPCRLYLNVTKPIRHFMFQDKGHVQEKDISLPAPVRQQSILHPDGQVKEVPVYRFDNLPPGAKGRGPVLLEDPLFTCRVLDGWSYTVNENGDLFLWDERGD